MKTLYILDHIGRMKKTNFVACLREGAELSGYSVVIMSASRQIKQINPDDILVLWNKHFLVQQKLSERFEQVGAKVWVFERAYLNVKDGLEWFTLGFGIHNNLEFAPPQLDNDGERFKSFNIEIKPWKKTGESVLIATQSKRYDAAGYGYRDYAHPLGWDSHICEYVNSYTNKEIILRQNPKTKLSNGRTTLMSHYISAVSKGDVTLREDIEKYDVAFTAVYTSGTSTDSLLEGVPVYLDGPCVIMKDACFTNIRNIEYPDNREQLCFRIAWAQYNENELKQGLLFTLFV